MNTLVIGPAGAGKTTLIENAYPDHLHLDVADFLGPPFPEPDDRKAFVAAYKDLAWVIRKLGRKTGGNQPLAVEVCPDFPSETMKPVAEALAVYPQPTQVVPVWATRLTCKENNLRRERVVPRRLIQRHHSIPLEEVFRELMRTFGV